MIEKLKRKLLNRDAHSKEILLKSSSAFVVKILGVFFGVVFTVFITRAYGADNYGILSLCINVVQIVSILVIMGFDTALLKYTAQYSFYDQNEEIKKVYGRFMKINIPVGILLTVVMYFISPLLAEKVFSKPHLTPYLQYSSLMVLPTSLLLMNASGLRGFKQIKEFSFIRESARFAIATVMLIILYFIFQKNEFVPLSSFIIATVITWFISLYMWQKRNWENKIPVQTSLPGYSEIFNLAVPLLLVSSLNQLTQIINSVMLGIYSTEQNVGIFNVATRVANFIALPLVAINSISAPKFAQFVTEKDFKSLNSSTHFSTKIIFWTSLPALLLCILFPSFVMKIFGSDFTQDAHILIYVAIGQFINAIAGSVGIIMQMTGYQKAFSNVLLMTTGINILLNAILIPRFGITGAAISSMVCVIFWNLACVAFIKIKFNILTIYFPFKTA